MNITLICEETFEGIMTAVYYGWIYMNKGYCVKIYPGENYELDFFSEYVHITTDYEKAQKVAKSIQVKISGKAYSKVYSACMHFDKNRGNVVFQFLKLAYPVGAKVTGMLGNTVVAEIMELSRKVYNEVHFFKEFIRFDELEGGILYSKIEPKCDVLTLVSQHFKDRFPEENWIIYDSKRMKSSVHAAQKECVIVNGKNMDDIVKDRINDNEYQELWKIFFNAIGIDARYNPKCQRTNLPLWYRKNMTEFKK